MLQGVMSWERGSGGEGRTRSREWTVYFESEEEEEVSSLCFFFLTCDDAIRMIGEHKEEGGPFLKHFLRSALILQFVNVVLTFFSPPAPLPHKALAIAASPHPKSATILCLDPAVRRFIISMIQTTGLPEAPEDQPAACSLKPADVRSES